MDVVTLSDDLKEHIDSIKAFLTRGSFAVELNHYFQLARDHLNLRTIDYINLMVCRLSITAVFHSILVL